MSKARRKEQPEQLKFPDPREGLPEDPRPFVGSRHLVAAVAVQEHLSARGLVAVVGRSGSGKSTVCRRAANSRWARQWFLQDENGHPVHRRFWVDLEDSVPGRDTEERVAHALGVPSFAEAMARLGNGRPGLLVLDNADHAFGDGNGDGAGNDLLAQLVACVGRGASIVVTRRSVSGLSVDRPWTDIVEVPGFGSHNEAKRLFDQLAPQHAADLRTADIVAACDRLPLAVSLLAKVAAEADLELARLRVGPAIESRGGLEFAIEVAAAMLDPVDRHLWGALSLFPSGLSGDEITEILSALAQARDRTIRLFAVGVAQRCQAGVRIPVPLRLAPPAAGLDDVVVSDIWQGYLRRAQAVVGPPPAPANGAGDAWLGRQVATLGRLASQPSLPEGAFDLACAGLLIHSSGIAADTLDHVLVRLLERSLPAVAAPATTAEIAKLAAALEDQRRFATSVLVAAALANAHRQAGDTGDEAEALCRLGRAERFAGRYHDAETHLLAALGHFEKLDDGVGRGRALFELGQVDLDLGRLDEAETHLGQALAIFDANGRPVGFANANLDLVRVDLARGRLDRAERRLLDALDRYQEAGDRLGFANACLQLGQVELARGRLDSAERRFGAALNGYELAGDKVGFANACLQLGQVELARGRLDVAERRFGGALAGYQLVGDKVGSANASLQLGQIDLARGRLAKAGPRLLQALTAYEHLGDRIGVANASLQLGQVDLGQGQLEDADQRLRAAEAAYDDIGDRMGSANSRQVAGMLRHAQGRHSQAMALFAEAGQLYSSLGRTASAGWSLAWAARSCTGRAERAGYTADAVRRLKDAGLAEAAAQLARELAEPDRPPEPDPPPLIRHHAYQPEPERLPQPDVRPGPEPASDASPQPDASPGPDQSQPQPEPDVNPGLEPDQSQPQPEPGPEADVRPGPEPEPESDSDSRPGPDASPAPEPAPASAPPPAPAPGRERPSEPPPQDEVESTPEREFETVAQALAPLGQPAAAEPIEPWPEGEKDPEVVWFPRWSADFEAAVGSAPLDEWKNPSASRPAPPNSERAADRSGTAETVADQGSYDPESSTGWPDGSPDEGAVAKWRPEAPYDQVSQDNGRRSDTAPKPRFRWGRRK